MNTNISEFTYTLPEDKIAKKPIAVRHSSKLLVYNKGSIIDESFSNCPNYVPTNTLLIFNNTKVIHARIIMQKSTGARIEIFCLEPYSPKNYEEIFLKKQTCSWKCIIGNAKKWKDGFLSSTFSIQGKQITFTASKIDQIDDTSIIEFSWNDSFTFSEILDEIGKIPIPPYLNRESEEIDNLQYQTIYAKHEGSVAAPTAGLHFTDSVLQKFENKQIQTSQVTLHVGAGTFKPVKTDTYTAHIMHHEYFIVTKDLIQKINEGNKVITAVGTTSVRTLESLYWLGVKLVQNSNSSIEELSQWEPYELPQDISLQESFSKLLEYIETKNLKDIKAYTQIMIVPGYTFRVVTSMFTNFHQPQSTLLLLISAFIGENWKTVYEHALHNDYRFLSYGDSSLLISDK